MEPNSSFFAYYRPRGVTGNYIVGINLELLSTETAVVNVNRLRQKGYNCGHCGQQQPVMEIKTEKQDANVDTPSLQAISVQDGRVERYLIDEFIVEDTITVEIHDTHVVPFQTILYTATIKEITATPQICWVHQRNFGIVSFHSIILFDYDKSSASPRVDQTVKQKIIKMLPAHIFKTS